MQLSMPSVAIETNTGSYRSEHNEAVMRQYIEQVLNQGDFSVLNDLVHPDYVYRAPGHELRGREQLQALFKAYRSAFPDLHIDIDQLVTTVDRVAVAFTLTGTHDGSLMGIAASGHPVSVNGAVFSRFRDGKIAEEWEILDQLSLFEQLGAVSLPV